MLVLTRREGEVITIGDGIEITVVRLHHHRVQLGITAPKSVHIQRQELRDRVARPELRGSTRIMPELEEAAP